MQTQITGKQLTLGIIDDSLVSATAAIQLSKIAGSNSLVKNDGSVPFAAVVAGVDPTLAQHLATKSYVDAVASGLDPKQSVRLATTANLTALTGLTSIDGVTPTAGNRILVKNQTTAAQNGIYVAASTAWTRATDADSSTEVTPGLHTFVEEGTLNGATGWVLTTSGVIAVGTTALTFVQFSGAGSYASGNGLTLTGTTFDVVSANGAIVSNATNIALTLADSTLSIAAGGLKLSALNSGLMMIGNASNVATGVAMSGDATLSNAGALSISNNAVATAKILDRNVTTSKLALNAVDETVTKQQAAGAFLVGQGASNVVARSMSGDATMAATGVVTLSAAFAKVANFVRGETPVGAIDNVNLTYTMANVPSAGTESVFVNGQLQDVGAGNDYTISGSVITMLYPLNGTDKIRVSYWK